MKSLSLTDQKFIGNAKVDNRQTDSTKTICPRSFDLGA